MGKYIHTQDLFWTQIEDRACIEQMFKERCREFSMGLFHSTFQKLRPQTEVTGKKWNRAGSWWKLQMQADLQTQDKLKESSCPQVAPVKGKKSYRNEMLP